MLLRIQRPQVRGALRAVVLGAFHGFIHGAAPAGDQRKRAVLRPAEGRKQLNAVEHAQPAGRAGAGVDEPTPGRDARDGGVHTVRASCAGSGPCTTAAAWTPCISAVNARTRSKVA